MTMFKIMAVACFGLLCGCERPAPAVMAPVIVAGPVPTWIDVAVDHDRPVGVHIGEKVPFYYKGMDVQMQDAECTVSKYERNDLKELRPEYDVAVTLHCKVAKP